MNFLLSIPTCSDETFPPTQNRIYVFFILFIYYPIIGQVPHELSLI